jgi:hypothetical protein
LKKGGKVEGWKRIPTFFCLKTIGFFGELAGLPWVLHHRRIDSAERIVVLVTSNGLKDVDSAIEASGGLQVIEPETKTLRNVVIGLSVAKICGTVFVVRTYFTLRR